ncbi:ferredoxin [Streptomyces yerevanensis]|uniref:ferredoxin n=1 Tax=Streptomyces yerevanensis TaxID=66378 RepID=UPI0005267192|nr:ferredoxin [Streptomyces yerevanensis]
MRIVGDRDRCAGSGLCADRLPEIFDQDDDAVVVTLVTHVSAELRDDVVEVVRMCPTEALSVMPD